MTPTPYYVPSPCIRQCTLDEQDICVGCGRSLDEIKVWSQVSADRQRAIIERAEKRRHPDRPDSQSLNGD